MFKTKLQIKKIISCFLTVTLLLSIMVTPVHAENTNSKTYTYDGYIIDYKIKSQWDKNQSIEVKITNTGSEPILNWAVKYNAGDEDGLTDWNETDTQAIDQFETGALEDGVTDKEDKFPLDCNAFDIMHTANSDSGIGYRFDHSYFFKDNTAFNKELCITSSIFASVVYEDIQLKNRADTSPGNAYIDE